MVSTRAMVLAATVILLAIGVWVLNTPAPLAEPELVAPAQDHVIQPEPTTLELPVAHPERVSVVSKAEGAEKHGAPLTFVGPPEFRPAKKPAPKKPKRQASKRHHIKVLVRDTSGQPIDMARVIPGRPLAFSGTFANFARFSESDGYARLRNLPDGLIRVVATKAGYAQGASEVIELSDVDLEHELVVTLTPGGRVTGQLLDLSGGTAAGVRVSISRQRGPSLEDKQFDGPWVSADTVTTADGIFLFEHLPTGRYRLLVDPKGEARGTVLETSLVIEVIDGQTTEVLFESHVGTSVRLSGSVVCDGKPLANATVEVDPFGFKWRGIKQSTTTNERGWFEIAVPESGECTIQVELDGGVSVYREINIPPAPTHEIEISIQTGAISGQVLGPDGSPLAGVELHAFGRVPGANGLAGSQFTSSDSDGQFHFTDLPDAVYRIDASISKHARPADYRPPRGIRGPIYGTVTHPMVGSAKLEGVKLGAEVILALPHAAAIECVVRGKDGDRVQSGLVRVWPIGGSPYRDTTDWSVDSRGVALAGCLAPREYMVRAETRGGVSPWQKVTAEVGREASVELSISDGTMVKVTATQAGAPVSGVSAHVGDPRGMPEPFDSMVAGSALLGPIAPGTYVVRVGFEGNGKPFGTKTIVVAGEELIQVHLDLP